MIFTCLTFFCLQQMTSTIPGRYDWNMVDQVDNVVLLVRWINPDMTLNMEYDNRTTTCWLYDGNGMLNCPDATEQIQ